MVPFTETIVKVQSHIRLFITLKLDSATISKQKSSTIFFVNFFLFFQVEVFFFVVVVVVEYWQSVVAMSTNATNDSYLVCQHKDTNKTEN